MVHTSKNCSDKAVPDARLGSPPGEKIIFWGHFYRLQSLRNNRASFCFPFKQQISVQKEKK